eukprot:CAMPEP_0206479252 /NCGR_PEP_ID=MMETSP0324_2-20121206/36559_1 /ASSEMBLY_ACC=CAM_ASM_000836 /TAXON_ID=2866 /ORGANISM="Crypthecodinium cohnii, Strain Seligo" /LENGTH=69 /DNA_ID=CAMNT_0053955755 /DNA_START=75 /DNA_END=284 /DNA_ORIENTATION=+
MTTRSVANQATEGSVRARGMMEDVRPSCRKLCLEGEGGVGRWEKFGQTPGRLRMVALGVEEEEEEEERG